MLAQAEHAGEHVAKFYQPSAGTARTLLSTVDNNLGKRVSCGRRPHSHSFTTGPSRALARCSPLSLPSRGPCLIGTHLVLLHGIRKPQHSLGRAIVKCMQPTQPHGRPKRCVLIQIDRNGIHELALMIRRPSVDIVNVLKAADADASQPPPRIVISGPSGTGKSLGLLHIADFCRAQGWAVAFIPDAPAWVDTEQTIMESVRDKERMDQNVLSAEWLSVFLKWNKELLANTMVNDGYNWDANAKGFTTDGMTLEGMAEVGIEDNRFACDMVGILLKQLVAISAETPMLLAMDGYNSWLKPQYDNFQDITLKPLDIDRASLVRHFAKLMLTANKGGLQRGGIVLVESLNHVEQNKVVQDKLLESSMRVQYGDFTSKEFRSYLDYHEATGWIHRGTVQHAVGVWGASWVCGSPRSNSRSDGSLHYHLRCTLGVSTPHILTISCVCVCVCARARYQQHKR